MNCRYRLRGLEENRCPECGRGFDPNDPSTFWPESGPPFPAGALAFSVLGILIATIAWMSGGAEGKLLSVFTFLAVAIVPIAVLLHWLIASRKFRD